MLNTALLGVCIGIVIGVVLYTFFWNRLAGLLISLVLRLLWWNQEGGSAWVELGAIQVQLLAGRVLIKELRYHTSNTTIRVLRCTVSWRYWLRKVSDEDDLNHARVGGEDSKTISNSTWPPSCRVHVSLDGVEWFLFNRTASYDEILRRMRTAESASAQPRKSGVSIDEPRSSTMREATNSSTLVHTDTIPSHLYPPSQPTLERFSTQLSTRISSRVATVVPDWILWIKRQLPNLDPKNLLPLSFRVVNGAVVCGNSATPNLIMSKFTAADGTYGIVQSRSKFDLYKTLLALRFQNAAVSYIDNADYVESQLDTGETLRDVVAKEREVASHSRPSYMSFSTFGKLWARLKLRGFLKELVKRTRHANVKPQAIYQRGWRRRKKKGSDDPTPVGSDWSTFEYAIERTILETPMLELSYYCDVPGKVPINPRRLGSDGLETFDVGNGDLAPEWGIDFVIHGGFLRYGPWADRQRAELQRSFFPSTFQDNTPAVILNPGDTRQFTSLKVFIELREDTTFQIPFREASKNWQWDGITEVKRPKKREPAYLHLKAGDNSTVSYVMPMVATSDGYDSICAVHLDDFSVTSSMNDIPLLSAESCKILCEMPTPLKWNAERQWAFDITIRKPALFLIRDHINMFTDLGKDWASGPPAPYNRFVPVVYLIKVGLDDYELNLYANDHNIIDKPLLREENALLTLRGARLRSEVRMASTKYRPEFSVVPFSLAIPDVNISMTLPKWNTHALFSDHFRTDLGRIGALNIDATFLYYSDVRADNIDRLNMKISAEQVALKAFGWAIRHFMIVRENYFGTFTIFSTLREYLSKRANDQVGDPLELKYRQGKSNIFQVEIQLDAGGTIMLPSELLGYESAVVSPSKHPCVLLSIPILQLHLRLHDYYMEMSLNLSSLSGDIVDHVSDDIFLGTEPYQPRAEQLVVDGLDIVANRLFGPQPRTSTYLCMWEIHLADVKTSLNAQEGQTLLSAVDTFRRTFVDPFNAPAPEFVPPVDHDITFLNIRVDSICALWHSDKAGLELHVAEGLSMKSNDLAGDAHRKVTSISIPSVNLKLLTQSNRNRWVEAASVAFDVSLDMYATPSGWIDIAQEQWKFVASQDALTNRGRFLLAGDLKPRAGYHFGQSGLFLPHPRLPQFNPRPAARWRERASRPIDENIQTHVDESESDGELVLDEEERDAQLAQNRISAKGSIAIAQDRGNEEESELEEEGEESTDYWSGTSTDSEDEKNHPVPSDLLYYQRFLRQYRPDYLRRPAYWVSTSCTLVHESDLPPCTPSRVPRATEDSLLPPLHLPQQWIDGSERDFDCSAMRVLCRRGVDILITPLAFLALDCLFSDVNSSVATLELRLDSMFLHFLTNSNPPAIDALSIVNANVSSVNVRSIQGVRSDGALNGLDLPHGSLYDCATTLDVGLSGISISNASWKQAPETVMRPSTWAVDVGMDALNIQLSKLTDRRAKQRRAFTLGLESVFELSISRSEGSFGPRVIKVDLGDVSTGVDALSLEYGLYTARSLQKSIKVWQDDQRTRREREKTLSVHVLLRLLQLGQSKTIMDPLSSIQPSYLVQSGRPHSLRTNTGYKLLFYLRNVLRHSDAAERESLLTHPPQSSYNSCVTELFPLLEEEWSLISADPELEPLHEHPILKALLPASAVPPASARPGVRRALPSVSLRFQGFVIFQRGTDETSRNSFQLNGLLISACSLSRAIIPVSRSKNMVSDSMTQKDRVSTIRQWTASCLISDVQIALYPQIINFIHQILRVQNKVKWPEGAPSKSESQTTVPSNPTPMHIDAIVAVTSLRMQISAQNVIVELALAGLSLASSAQNSKSHPGSDLSWSANQSLVCNQIALRALMRSMTAKSHKHDLLASIILTEGKANAVVRTDPVLPLALRSVASLGSLQLSVPRSALKLYRFIEEWREDYLPGLESAVRSLLSELDRRPTGRPKPPPRSNSSMRQRPRIHVTAALSSILVSLQVMHGTWLEWGVNDVSGFVHSGPRVSPWSFGVELRSQFLSIVSTSRSSRSVPPNAILRLNLPTIRMAADYGRPEDAIQLHARMLIDFFELTISSSDLDTILSVQQKFGKDFHDLLHLIEQTRQGAAVSTPSPSSPPVVKSSFGFEGVIKLHGLQIGFQGPKSTLYLECKDVEGLLERDRGDDTWNIVLRDLALSLAPNSTHVKDSLRKLDYRSAFLTIDLAADNKMAPHEKEAQNTLHIFVPKVNAVMQPSSVGEVGDYVDHILADMSQRREQRAQEFEEFKLKTRNVMRTFDLKVRPVGPQHASSWLDKRTIKIRIRHIGVAFPLTIDNNLEILQPGSQDGTTVKAFLFSIKRVDFTTQRGETGQASMHEFNFQFVNRFRQSVPADFLGETHPTRNRLCYPEMEARLKTVHTTAVHAIYVEATVSGFVLDLDPSIPDFIFSLIDVYRHGKDRVDRLAVSLPRVPSHPTSPGPKTPPNELVQARVRLHVQVSMLFESGRIRFHSNSDTTTAASRSRPIFSHTIGNAADGGAEVFVLPQVSVWSEYRAPSDLIFKATIHSSENRLSPVLLPFVSEIVNKVENRMSKSAIRHSRPPSLSTNLPLPLPDSGEAAAPVSRMHITFSLRIDQSKLELTCQPDVNVVGGIHWQSGGFVVTISPGAQGVVFTGSVDGLSIGLKHGFLSDDCVHFDARNLSFNLAFSKVPQDGGDIVNSVSLVLDTELAGGVRFSRLQDVLCFKAVWLDRIPVFAAQSTSDNDDIVPDLLSASSTPKASPQTAFVTAILVRIRSLRMEADLGQSISNVNLDFDNLLVRTKLTDYQANVAVSMEKIQVKATGNVSGHLVMPGFLFSTVRRREAVRSPRDRSRSNKMLELKITTGPLDLLLHSEFQKLLQYSAQPVEVTIFDDWSMFGSAIPISDRRLRLAFTVTGGDVTLIATVGTIPKLVAYGYKFKALLDNQREGASRESEAFRITRTPKPDNPLSDVATAMIQAARDRLKEVEGVFSYVIRQHMSLRLDQLRIVVFPRSMHDFELARFTGTVVQAQLDRVIEGGTSPAHRDLHLSFGSMGVARFSQLNQFGVGVSDKETSHAHEWLHRLLEGSSEATIFGLPAMSMLMASDESITDGEKTVTYDFQSTFSPAGQDPSQGGAEENIYISLNISLYSWLTALRKNFTREMENADRRTAVGGNILPSSTGLLRKKASPEVLSPSLSSSSNEKNQSGASSRPGSRPASRPSTPPPTGEASPMSPHLSPPHGLTTKVTPNTSPVPPPATPKKDKGKGKAKAKSGITYVPRSRHIERLTMRQLGEATPDVMHPFFMKTSGFNLEDSLPQYVHEYATAPIEEILKALLELYSKQLRSASGSRVNSMAAMRQNNAKFE